MRTPQAPEIIYVPFVVVAPQWEASDAEIKDPSGENTELARSPFEVWSRFNI